MEVTTIVELIKGISKGATIDSASNTDCDEDACNPQAVTFVAAIAAVDMLHIYFGGSELGKNIGSQLDGAGAAILKLLQAKRIQGILDSFFQTQ